MTPDIQGLSDAIGAKPIQDPPKGVILLHLNHNLSTEMTLLVGMLVFIIINKFPWDFDGNICHQYENVQNSLQNKNKI